MDPRKLTEDEDKPKVTKDDLKKFKAFYDESKALAEVIEHRMARSLKIEKGVPVETEKMIDPVTGRNKIFFRKSWATKWRILADLYRAFLADKNRFKIWGVGEDEKNFVKAKILTAMTRYRMELMQRRHSLFVKMIWAFLDCISPGTAVVKFCWGYNEESGVDGPMFVNYPFEQVKLDWVNAMHPEEMRYAFFDNYLTEDQLEEEGLSPQQIKKMTPVEVPISHLRQARYYGTKDPFLASSSDTGNYSNGAVGSNFPSPGSDPSQNNQPVTKRYHVVEGFYRRSGKIYMCKFDKNSDLWVSEPELSPYGKVYPLIVGHMLLEAHKFIPEDLISVLEGPQESLNLGLNLRKANQRLSMQSGFAYNRLLKPDLQAMQNFKPGMRVAVNGDPNAAIAPFRIPDVTQTSYMEVNADQVMMDELSGVNPAKNGDSNINKTGVVQANLAEANAKIELYVAIVSETFFRQFIYLLAYYIQLFETDERIFKVAKIRMQEEEQVPVDKRDNIYDLDFDMMVEIHVGLGEVSRAARMNQDFAFMQQLQAANQSTIMALKSGIGMDKPVFYDVGAMILERAEDYGFTNLKRYAVPVQSPPQEPTAGPGGSAAQSVEGGAAAQPNAPGAEAAGFEEALRAALGQ